MESETAVVGRTSARERLLAAADELFYEHGINRVGIGAARLGAVAIHGAGTRGKAAEPERLGQQLVLLYDGAAATAHLDGDKNAPRAAREIAAKLLPLP